MVASTNRIFITPYGLRGMVTLRLSCSLRPIKVKLNKRDFSTLRNESFSLDSFPFLYLDIFRILNVYIWVIAGYGLMNGLDPFPEPPSFVFHPYSLI